MSNLEDSSDSEVFKKPERFIWTVVNTQTLLELYEKNIDNFLSKTANQTKQWTKLVVDMKPEVPEDYRERLTANKAKSKFASLQKKFKEIFFSSDPKQQENFPFYNQMNKMLTEYATRKLEESGHDYSDPNATDSLYTSLIIDALNSTSIVLSAEIGDEDTGSTKEYKLKPSQTSVIQRKLAKLPENELCIQKQKLPIDPNTPFNRNINNSTLPDQKSSFANSQRAQPMQKRRLKYEPELVAKKLKPAIRMNSTEVNNNTKSVMFVEALEECELSNIDVQHSKVIYQEENSNKLPLRKPLGESSKVQVLVARPKPLMKRVYGNKNKAQSLSNSEHQSFSTAGCTPNRKEAVSKRSFGLSNQWSNRFSQSSSALNQSSIDVPSFNITEVENDYSLLLNEYEEEQLFKIIEETPKNVVPKSILRETQSHSPNDSDLIKKLQGNPHISITAVKMVNKEEETPGWFKNFLEKYEKDKESINNKLDYLLKRL